MRLSQPLAISELIDTKKFAILPKSYRAPFNTALFIINTRLALNINVYLDEINTIEKCKNYNHDYSPKIQIL